MEWKPEYEVGIEEIDGQHRAIIQLVTEFEAAVEAESHWNSLHTMITHAEEFARIHFATEENLMQRFKYPRFLGHRSEHLFILERISDLKREVLRKEMSIDLVPRFRNWLLGHFQDSDRHFADFVRDQN
jgi:hemerythrin-like metal-binding protein